MRLAGGKGDMLHKIYQTNNFDTNDIFGYFNHNSHLSSFAIYLTRSSRLPSSHKLLDFLVFLESVLLMSTKGVVDGIIVAKAANGNTTRDVPMIITRSAYSTKSTASPN